MAQEEENILNWSNLFKVVSLVSALVVGFWHVENVIRNVVTETIDQRLEAWINKTNDLSKKVEALSIICNKNVVYVNSNNYEMKYHEEVIRSTYRVLNNKFPLDFIKPDELRFEDYREEKNN